MSDVHINPPGSLEEQPWWWYRCIHRSHEYYIVEGSEYGCWRVLKEAEGVAILQLICLAQFHILVDRPGIGSMCQTLKSQQFNPLFEDEAALLRYVQSQWKSLQSVSVRTP